MVISLIFASIALVRALVTEEEEEEDGHQSRAPSPIRLERAMLSEIHEETAEEEPCAVCLDPMAKHQAPGLSAVPDVQTALPAGCGLGRVS